MYLRNHVNMVQLRHASPFGLTITRRVRLPPPSVVRLIRVFLDRFFLGVWDRLSVKWLCGVVVNSWAALPHHHQQKQQQREECAGTTEHDYTWLIWELLSVTKLHLMNELSVCSCGLYILHCDALWMHTHLNSSVSHFIHKQQVWFAAGALCCFLGKLQWIDQFLPIKSWNKWTHPVLVGLADVSQNKLHVICLTSGEYLQLLHMI